jgi:hypothetical protein
MASLKTNHRNKECLGIEREYQTNFHQTTIGFFTLISSQVIAQEYTPLGDFQKEANQHLLR